MADESGSQTDPANSGAGGGQSTPVFTQDQVNHFNAEAKRGALSSYFKELGFDAPPTAEELKQRLEDATEYAKLQDGKKDEVTRLNDQLAAEREKANKVSGLEAQVRRTNLAADSELPPRLWKYLTGSTDEEIQKSIADTMEDFGIKATDDGNGGGGQQSGGSGSGLTPNQQQGSGNGTPPKKTMDAGKEAYEAKYGKKE